MVEKVVERWNFGLSQVPNGLDLSGFIKLIGADRVGDYIRISPLQITRSNGQIVEDSLLNNMTP